MIRHLFIFFSRWPLWLLHPLGQLLGWLSFALSGSYRRRFLANAAQAGLSPAQVLGGVAAAGQMLTELPPLWMRPHDQTLGAKLQWSGEDLLQQALNSGQGLMLLTPHLGCFEVCAQAYAERFGAQQPITVLFRPARKAWLRPLVNDSRLRPHLHTAPANLSGVRQMIKALRQGQTIGLLPDQVPPEGQGLWLPFFGKPAYTMTLSARLAQQTGATLLLIWGERRSWGRGYHVHLQPFPFELSADLAQATGQINQAMEQLILQKPDQYLWGYERYKHPRAARAQD